MTIGNLPDDVYEESGCRLPLPKREDIDGEALQIFDHHQDPESWSLAGMRGPGGIKLHSPRLSERSQAIGRYLRREADYPPTVRELAILVTAREMDSRFEWAAHEPEALRVGVTPEVIDVVRHRKPTDGLEATDALIIDFGRQLFREKKVDAPLFARALETFGKGRLVDLVSLMGTYAGTALLLAAFDVQLTAEEEALLPVP